MKSRQLIAILAVALILFLVPTLAKAANNVSVNSSTNNSLLQLSATWTEYENLSLSPGTAGTTKIVIALNGKVNYSTAMIYGRFKRNGAVISTFNITASTYPDTVTYYYPYSESSGTPYYTFEAYSTAGRKGEIYNRTFLTEFISSGSYGTGSGGAGNVSSVTGAPVGILDCTGTDAITCALAQASASSGGYLSAADWNIFNSKITNATAQITRSQVTGQEGVDTTQNTSISNLQTNDTTHDSKFNYVNATYLPNSTYNGNFPNTSLSNYLLIATYGSNFPNSSLANYLLITTYNGNYPNSTVSSKSSTWDAKADATYANQTFYNKSGIPACTGTDKLTNTTGVLTCATDQTSSFSLNGISGAATINGDATVSVSVSGSNINLSAPGLTVTNVTVDPYKVNASNLTGSINQSVIIGLPESRLSLNYPTHAQNHTLNGSDHTGNLNWSRLDNITVNLSAISNLTGQLIDAYIASATTWNAKISSVAGSSPIVATTVGTAVTVTCNVVNSTQAGCLSSADWTTFNGKTTLAIVNASAQIAISQVTALQATLDAMDLSSANNNTASLGRDATQNASISILQQADAYFNGSGFPASANFRNDTITGINATLNGTNRVRGMIGFSTNSSVRLNGSDINSVPAPYDGQITDLNITVVSGTGTANVSWYVSGSYVGSVNLTSGSFASTAGLSAAFTTSDTIKATLDSASSNLRFSTTARTRRS